LFWVLCATLILTFQACSPYKAVPESRYLLKNYKIKVEEPIRKPKTNQIHEQIRTKRNRRVLGFFGFHLRAYSLGTSKRNPQKNETKKIRKFLRDKVGEAPVLLDSVEIKKSVDNIEQLMFNNGYFNNEVSFSVKTKGKRRRRAFITYYIKPKEVYTVDQYNILSSEFAVDSLIQTKNKNQILKTGSQVDFDEITAERSRINDIMRNSGYFYFGKEYVEFDLDSANHKVDIECYIISPENGEQHRLMRYGQTHVTFPVIEVYSKNRIETVYWGSNRFDLNGYPLDIDLLEKRIYTPKDSLFAQKHIDKMYAKLTELSLFRVIDISFKPNDFDTLHTLDVYIHLTPYTKQSYSIEPQGVLSYNPSLAQDNQRRNYGVGNAFTYVNRNSFGRAEQLDLSAVTSFQAQFGKGGSTIFEQSVNARLRLPGSKLLKHLDNNPKVLNLSTQINISYIYQRNPDYKRNILPMNLTYVINKKKQNNWLLTPIEINFNRSTVTPSFFNKLDAEQQKFISILFARNLLTSSNISYYTNRVSKRSSKRTWFIRANVLELGGNSLYALSKIGNFKQDTLGTYYVLNVPFSQYVKSDIDIRLTKKIDENNTFVYRANVGMAFPYGNRQYLPIDKRYFIGGANSLRGWNPRSMGPGNFQDTTNSISLNRTGEILILANIEYRFALIRSKVEMALFADGGNIWNLVEANSDLEKFRLNNLLNSTAFNTGIGLRLDFKFLMVRLDWGIRMHNPALPKEQRWIIREIGSGGFLKNQTCLNFGLDYPF